MPMWPAAWLPRDRRPRELTGDADTYVAGSRAAGLERPAHERPAAAADPGGDGRRRVPTAGHESHHRAEAVRDRGADEVEPLDRRLEAVAELRIAGGER